MNHILKSKIPDAVYSMKGVAKQLSIGRTKLYALINEDEIRAVKQPTQ